MAGDADHERKHQQSRAVLRTLRARGLHRYPFRRAIRLQQMAAKVERKGTLRRVLPPGLHRIGVDPRIKVDSTSRESMKTSALWKAKFIPHAFGRPQIHPIWRSR